ncbi:MAG TPA: hypothetical protein ENI76_10855 [Ignavibacteria bacterium]|nr:hypothetical protein [Ignavibacteria bacterium]
MKFFENILIALGFLACLALVFLSCGDKTTTNNYATDNSSIDTNVTDVDAGDNDQSEQPDNSVDNSDNSDSSDNSTSTIQ